MLRGQAMYDDASATTLVVHRHRQRAEQVVRERRIVKLEVPLVVELEQRGRVGMLLLQVHVVHLRLVGRVATLLAHVHLRGREPEINEKKKHVSKTING